MNEPENTKEIAQGLPKTQAKGCGKKFMRTESKDNTFPQYCNEKYLCPQCQDDESLSDKIWDVQILNPHSHNQTKYHKAILLEFVKKYLKAFEKELKEETLKWDDQAHYNIELIDKQLKKHFGRKLI